jgi:hypothetical protein
LCKKIDLKKIFKILTSDSSSSTLITFRSTLIAKIPFMSLPYPSTNQWGADTQASNQTINVCKTLLYEKENNIDSNCDFSAQVFLRTRLVRQIRWDRNVKKPYWSKSRPKITFLDWITGQRNLIGWIAPPPPEILLVETAMSKNLIGRSPVQK